MVALGWKSRGVGVVSAFARGGTCIRILPTPPLVLSRILPRPFRIACFQCVRRPGRARAPSSVRAPPSPGGTVRGRARACLPCLRRPGCARAPLAGGSGARACARLRPQKSFSVQKLNSKLVIRRPESVSLVTQLGIGGGGGGLHA